MANSSVLRLILLWILLLLIGCNPVKKVLQSKEATEKVVREYVKNNPPKNDTLFIPGEVIHRDTTIYDSVPVPYPVNHKYTETRIIEQHIRDTIKVIDRSFIEALNNRLTGIENSLIQMTKERDYWKKEAQNRLYILIGIMAAIISGIVILVIRALRPKLTFGK